MDNLGDCDEICVNHPRCLSYNYQFDTRSPKHSCEINDATGTVCPQDMVPRRGYRYYEDQVNELTSCCITKFIESRSKEILMVVVSTQSLQHMGTASYGRVSRTIPYFFILFFLLSLQFTRGKNTEKGLRILEPRALIFQTRKLCWSGEIPNVCDGINLNRS